MSNSCRQVSFLPNGNVPIVYHNNQPTLSVLRSVLCSLFYVLRKVLLSHARSVSVFLFLSSATFSYVVRKLYISHSVMAVSFSLFSTFSFAIILPNKNAIANDFQVWMQRIVTLVTKVVRYSKMVKKAVCELSSP